MRALITGAAQGIGKATALAYARASYDLVLIDINAAGAEKAAAECQALGAKATSLVCDVTDEAQVEGVVKQAAAQLGGLDILVNTAAWLDPPIPVAEMPKEVWDRSITTDLTSVFLCSKHALQVMIPQGTGGRVINLSSGAGRRGRANRSSYGAAKAAIINLTESIALEVGQYGITCNAICPGGVIGDRSLNIHRQLAERQGRSREEGEREYEQMKNRYVTEEQVAELCVFLASPQASRINGQNIGIG
ncbi:MAG TPA: SDR family oxidoreductase [Dehalococcoidia bacterium]|jgi:NAD(P)-dependent dehydrogenase (short-subunit alcohol dehydrogenase family)|nr:SDR family oxidoreductase [Dehalococcoidia bacterium]